MGQTAFKIECLVRYRVSKAMSKFHHAELPSCVLKPIIYAFEKSFKVDGDAFESREFSSFSDYFSRELKDIDQQRPIQDGLVSPVDADRVVVQEFEESNRVSVKSTDTNLRSFLGFELKSQDFFAIQFYLSQRNYHRIHCPLQNLTITDARYLAGERLMIDALNVDFLSQNERAVFKLQTPRKSEVYLVMTGAFCVGNIMFSPTKQVLDQASIGSTLGVNFSKRQEMARFAFGSSVSLILPRAGYQLRPGFSWCNEAKVGQSLCVSNSQH